MARALACAIALGLPLAMVLATAYACVVPPAGTPCPHLLHTACAKTSTNAAPPLMHIVPVPGRSPLVHFVSLHIKLVVYMKYR